MIRARSPHHKYDRRLALVAAAREALRERDYTQVGLAQVAQAVQLTKASTFTYFRSKEALFLQVLQFELDDWFTSLNARLPHTTGASAVADLLANSLWQRPVLRRLLAILHTVLEVNVTADDLRPFKQFLLDQMSYTGQRLAKSLDLPLEQGITLLLQLDALLIGLEHLGNPAQAVAEVLAEPELTPLRVDLQPALRMAFLNLIQGAIASK